MAVSLCERERRADAWRGDVGTGNATPTPRQLGQTAIRLYTGEPLTDLIDWYARSGYEMERREQRSDRTIVHMLKTLAPRTPARQTLA